MLFAYDTVSALNAAVALVNTDGQDADLLTDTAALTELLDRHEFTGRRDGTAQELDQVRRLRSELRRIWTLPERDQVVELINSMLTEVAARPQLVRHDTRDWHLHLTAAQAPLRDRIVAETAMAVADLVRVGELVRLGICAAPDCHDVWVDLTRNRSKRFCDSGNCGNRQHVAAYRARLRG